MTYTEAKEYSLKVKWKLTKCSVGNNCWCRAVMPKKNINYGKYSKITVIEAGCIKKIYAEHIVKVHNFYIDNRR